VRLCVWSSHPSSCTRSTSSVRIDRSALKASFWPVPEASGEVGSGLELFGDSSNLLVAPTVLSIKSFVLLLSSGITPRQYFALVLDIGMPYVQ
jgi:hypothetical protein